MSNSTIVIENVGKTYNNGFQALKHINLEIQQGEIFALLGPNGAGKTTLISSICGIVNYTSGRISVCGYDIRRDYRQARACIGLVPQELTTDAFETTWFTVSFSRGLFGKPPNPVHIEHTLKRLALWDKKDAQLRTLSGGMKRRVMIAKALSHEPMVLFLDEPTAGVDVELRKSMWEQVNALRETGVTVILTTHYLEEAEQMADRVGVINKGELILVEEKKSLMRKMGKKTLMLELHEPLSTVPGALEEYALSLAQDGLHLVFHYDVFREDHGVAEFLHSIRQQGIRYKDIVTEQSSLEEIFIQMVNEK